MTSGHLTEMAFTLFNPPQSKTHAASKLHGSIFCGTGVIAEPSFTLRESGFSTYFAFVILTITFI